MRLYVEELRATALVQEFTRTTTALVPLIRLHLCKYLEPAGYFTLSITDEDDNVIASKGLGLNDMVAAGNDQLQAPYYHGFVAFYFDKAVTLRPGRYKLKLLQEGASYDPDEFMGWVKSVTDRSIDVTDGLDPSGINSPFDFEIYALERPR